MNVEELVRILVILLVVATGVALVSRWLRAPYIIGLVLAGLAITELIDAKIGLNGALIFNVFLPILVFEAAINTDISRLRTSIKPIALLAGPGVIISSGITALVLKFALDLTWTGAALIGVILAITDTVSVIAVFKEVSVPSRLATIVEGESLFNDGMALVLFSLILKINADGSISILDGLQEFFVVIVGGTIIGLAVGYLAMALFIKADEPFSSILLTIAVALGAFQVSESIHVSGVVAVVIAGLIIGTLGISSKVSASTRLTLVSFWESMSFGVNSFIFLLIGIQVDLITLWQTLPAVLLAIVAYQIARILSVYPLLAILGKFDHPIPWKWQHVLFFGNIKGSLSMALALSLPATLLEQEKIIAIVFGTVLLSVIGQGLSLPWFVKKLNLAPISTSIQKVEELQAQLITSKAAQDELESLLKTGFLPKAIYEEMRAGYQVNVAAAEKTLREFYNRRADEFSTQVNQHRQFYNLRRRLLLVEKAALNEAFRKQILSDNIVGKRIKIIDEQLLNLKDD